MKKSFIPIAVFLLVLVVAGCGRHARGDENTGLSTPAGPSISSRECKPSGKERFTLQIDGVLMGAFEKYNNGIFENGLVIKGPYLLEWLKYNRSHPIIRETHDIRTHSLSESLRITSLFSELIEMDITKITALPSSDRPTCLIVDRVEFQSANPTSNETN